MRGARYCPADCHHPHEIYNLVGEAYPDKWASVYDTKSELQCRLGNQSDDDVSM